MKLSHRRADGPPLITEAQPSQSAQSGARMRRYLIMMSVRTVSLILATVFYKIPILLGVFAVAAVVLPWMAVLMANDRPPKRPIRLPRLWFGQPADREVAAPDRRALPEPAGPRVIDPDDPSPGRPPWDRP
ncbi:MAG: DUF3099 domain-containing protein [Actinobacteria bacterium]|nr:DUF3099 domain-containing protein [Actinomycetota bacterium]